MSVFIIAELGINHNGSLSICKKMIKSAKECGADAVKLQLLTPELISAVPWLREVQKRAMLTYEEFIEAKQFAENIGIEIFSSIGDVEAFNLFKRLGFKRAKISSSNLNNLPLHEMVAELGIPVIVSTGDAFLHEIARVVDFYKSKGIEVALTHCVPDYPAKPEDIFLKTMQYVKDNFDVTIGFSDHTKGILASVVAASLGAELIEKHFMVDEEMEIPDEKFSLNPKEFSMLVFQIREMEKMLGSSHDCFFQKLQNKESVVRRAIIFIRNKSAGYVIKPEDVIVGRPKFHCEKEMHPFDYRKVIGKELKKDIGSFEPLTCEHI